MLKIAVTDNTITVSDGTRTRRATYRTPQAAQALATKYKNNPGAGVRWLDNAEPESLGLPVDIARRVMATGQ